MVIDGRLYRQISTHLSDGSNAKPPEVQVTALQRKHRNESERKASTPDSGFRSAGNGNGSDNNGSCPQTLEPTPRMSFSPADSLDSSVTLVSGAKDYNNGTSLDVVPKKKAPSKVVGETMLEDGTVEICYASGNRKVISADKRNVTVHYYNGDVKESLASGLVKYFYAGAKTWHLTYPDKKEVFQFSK